MIQYFYGEDQYRIEHTIRQQAQAAGGVVRCLEAVDIFKQRDWQEQLTPGPSLFAKEILVLKNVTTLTPTAQKELAELIKNKSIADLIIWDELAPDKRSALFKSLKPLAQEYLYQDDRIVVADIQKFAQDQGGTVSPRAAQEIINRLGKNGWRWRSEVSRLLLVTTEITEDVVKSEIPAPLQTEIFHTIEAIARGEAKLALTKLLDTLDADDNVFYVLSMLAYQFKTLYYVKTGQGEAKKLHPYVIQKSQSLAARFTAQQLLDILTRILAVDVTIKQGKIDPRTGLTMVVLGLVQQPHSAKASRS